MKKNILIFGNSHIAGFKKFLDIDGRDFRENYNFYFVGSSAARLHECRFDDGKLCITTPNAGHEYIENGVIDYGNFDPWKVFVIDGASKLLVDNYWRDSVISPISKTLIEDIIVHGTLNDFHESQPWRRLTKCSSDILRFYGHSAVHVCNPLPASSFREFSFLDELTRKDQDYLSSCVKCIRDTCSRLSKDRLDRWFTYLPPEHLLCPLGVRTQEKYMRDGIGSRNVIRNDSWHANHYYAAKILVDLLLL